MGFLLYLIYVTKRKDTISAYVNSTEICNICKGTKAPLNGYSIQLVWWKKYEKEKCESEIVIEISDDNESGNSLAGEKIKLLAICTIHSTLN